MTRLRGEDGVSLIELLVSMSVMALVMALAGPTLLSAMTATNRLERTQSAVDDAQLIAARLDRELRSAICIREPAENGSGNELVFDQLTGDSVTRITYTVSVGEVSRRQDDEPAQVLATDVGPTTHAFTQVATPLRTVDVAIPLLSVNGGTFLLQTTIAGRNAWRSC